MFFSNKSFLSQRDFETRTISCFTSFETGLDEKKNQEKVTVRIFVHAFYSKSGETEISPKAKKDNPMDFLAGNGKTVSRRAKGFIWKGPSGN